MWQMVGKKRWWPSDASFFEGLERKNTKRQPKAGFVAFLKAHTGREGV